MQNPTPFDALLQTIAANHGLNNGLNTGLPEKTAKTAKADLRKKRAEVDDAAVQSGESLMPSDEAALAASADASNAPLRLAQAETGTRTDAMGGSSAASPASATAVESAVKTGAANPEDGDDAIPFWPILGGVAAVAAVAGGGGAAAAAAVGFTISGSIVLGPVVEGHGLTVAAYRADGTQLATGTVNADGTYTLTVTENYTGAVLVRVVDANDVADYRDEATNATKDLTTDLRAVTVIPGSGAYTVNLNALTELAVRELGVAAGDNGESAVNLGAISTTEITTAKANVATAVGLGGTNLISDQVTAVIKADGTDNSANANDYGKALAAISGREEGTDKTTSQVLDDMKAEVDHTTGTMTDAGKNEIIAGASNVSQVNTAVLAEKLGLNTTAASAADAAWAVIHTAADGTDDNDTKPTQAQYTAIGVAGVDTAVEESLLGDVIDIKASTAVDTVAEVQALADIAGKVMLHAAGTAQTISQTELASLGITNLTAGRTDDLLNKIAASADDGSGVDTLAELQAMVDTTAPTLAITSSASAVKAGETATITFTFSEAPTGFAAGDVTTTGGTLSEPVVTADNKVYTATFTPTENLASGTASITVASAAYTDAAGNTGGAGTTPSISIDTLAPTISSVTAGWGTSLNATEDNANGTVTVTTSGVENGQTVTVTLNGVDYTGTVSGNSAAVTVTAAGLQALTNGSSYTLTANVSDAAGNAATAHTGTSFTVDTAAPTLTVGSVDISADTGTSATDFITNTASQTITGTLSGALSSGDILYGSVDNGSNWIDITSKVTGTAISWDGATLSGSSNILFKVTDAAGNDGTVASQAYVLDTAAPAANFTSATDDTGSVTGALTSGNTTDDTALVLAGTCEAGSTVEVFNGSTGLGAATVSGTGWSYTATVANGITYQFNVKESDAAGNLSTATSNFTVIGDTAAPTLTVGSVDISADSGTSATDFITNTASQTITGTLSAALAAGDILYGSVDNGANWTNITSKASDTAISWDGATLSGSSTIKIKVTDAAGNDGTVASQAYVLDTAAPTVSSVVISASGASGSLLNAGDVVTVTATYDGSVEGQPSTAPTLTIGSETGIALTAGTTTGNTRTWTYTISSTGTTDTGSISVVGDLVAGITDAAGNAATGTTPTATGSFTADTTAPTFTSATTANFAENATGTVLDATADSDTGIAYTLSGTDAGVFSINSGSGLVTFNSSPNFEIPTDSGAHNVYNFNINATDAAGNTAAQEVAVTVTDVVESLAGQATISLGAGYGNLIAPVQVEGSWYYYWDRSGDGTSGGVDYTTHDVLDGIFTYASDFTTTGGGGNTDNTYRYATLNGVRLALPTANGGVAYPQGIDAYQNGTSYTDAGASSNGTTSTFNELLAIWDAYNGTGTNTNSNGTPTGWRADGYWSATPSTSGHASVGLNDGSVNDPYDPGNEYVALQVL